MLNQEIGTMKKFILALCIVGATWTNSHAQQELYRTCDTDVMWKEAVKADPEAAVRNSALREFRKQFAGSAQRVVTQAGTILYRIPVVFHVMHTYGIENISKAQIEDAVRIMNQSFQKLNADTGMVIPLFQPIFADCQIEFVLANIDPNGNCTDGITRTYTPLTYGAGDNVKALVDWPSDQYFNIWVVKSIGSGAAGYAYYPGINSAIDGVVIRHDYVGSMGSASSSNYSSRSLTHEVGHWLDLPHTWGSSNTPGDPNNCNIDDGINDTPNTIGVANFSCNTAQITCSTIDNVQNYMDYASCHYMFTEGQKAAMHAALNSSVGDRVNLWQSANLSATGTEPGHGQQVCVPRADFDQKTQNVCQGTPVHFYDVSYGAPVAARTWYFPGGIPATDTSANPVVIYNAPGTYTVKLVVSNNAGSDSLIRTSNVIVIPSPGTTQIPFAEGFETITFPATGWTIENPDQNNQWQLTSLAGATGTKSLRLINQSGNNTGSRDAVILPSFDLTNVNGTMLSFKYAYAAKNSADSSSLKVWVSNNCGTTWYQRFSAANSALPTAPLTGGSFVPSASQWSTHTVNLMTTMFSGKPSVRVKFEFTNDLGNNIYIDDINISGTTGTNEILASRYEFEAFPNPSRDRMQIRLNLDKSSTVRLEIADLAGRQVSERTLLNASGQVNEEIDGAGLSGIYLLRVTVNGERFTQRIAFVR